ncbi:MAG: prolyl oligopeptidase family serine peptidase, partial [Casimicrobiaceae bacterium]
MTLTATPATPVTPAPFGSWASPIAAAQIAGATIRLGQIRLQGNDIFWNEGRPQEQGRTVVVRRSADGEIRDLNPPPFDVRTTAHEYGGGAYTLHGETLLFSHFADQQLYFIGASGTAAALTQAPKMRYADAVVDAARQRLIAVREDHARGDIDAVATLVAIDLRSGDEHVLAAGHDFFSSPRLSPDGKQLAWLSWAHPNMPWDGTTLWLADIGVDGMLGAAQAVAGGPGESIFQPEWSPAGELHSVSDRTGWWNLYRLRGAVVQPLCPMAAEFGEPQWVFGMSSYGFAGGGRIVCAYTQQGRAQLAVLDTETLRLDPIATSFCAIASLQVGSDFAVFIGGSETAPEAVVRIDLASQQIKVLRSASNASADPDYVSRAEAISYPTEGGLQAHAFFYPPGNRDFTGAPGERPPLLVFDHGGPTSATSAAFKWGIQFWTSRGFAVVDVNYGGSSGYGRAYRERL